jgi:cobalt/nickel transport system ATP-binding protein
MLADTAPPKSALARLLRGSAPVWIGAMGTRAKTVAREEGIALDFTYGVIDTCLLRAVNGEDSLALTSGGMVAHTVERITEYARTSGREIAVRRV